MAELMIDGKEVTIDKTGKFTVLIGGQAVSATSFAGLQSKGNIAQ